MYNFMSKGSKVISGGLDTLELIGKKTIDILTEGDPGLRNKRNLFSGDDTTLSQVLLEITLNFNFKINVVSKIISRYLGKRGID